MARLTDRINSSAGGQPQLRQQQARLRALIARLGQESVASFVLLVDSAGQALAHWCRVGELDVAAIATLTAGGASARKVLSERIGAGSQQSIVVHEYDGQVVMLLSVDENLVLLIVLEDFSRLGWTRVVLKRAAGEIARCAAQEVGGPGGR